MRLRVYECGLEQLGIGHQCNTKKEVKLARSSSIEAKIPLRKGAKVWTKHTFPLCKISSEETPVVASRHEKGRGTMLRCVALWSKKKKYITCQVRALLTWFATHSSPLPPPCPVCFGGRGWAELISGILNVPGAGCIVLYHGIVPFGGGQRVGGTWETDGRLVGKDVGNLYATRRQSEHRWTGRWENLVFSFSHSGSSLGRLFVYIRLNFPSGDGFGSSTWRQEWFGRGIATGMRERESLVRGCLCVTKVAARGPRGSSVTPTCKY